jgi:hypothetical protein
MLRARAVFMRCLLQAAHEPAMSPRQHAGPSETDGASRSSGSCGALPRFRPMPRYFFDLYNDVNARDEEGRDFPDPDAMKQNALIEVRTMMGESVCNGSR